MPNEADPSYEIWKRAIFEEISDFAAGAILIGHSIGATIMINALADSHPKLRLAGVFLIASPFVGRGGWPSDEIKPMDDIGTRLPAKTVFHLYHGDKDETAPFAHVDLYEKAMPAAIVHRLHGRNHQLKDDLTEVVANVRGL